MNFSNLLSCVLVVVGLLCQPALAQKKKKNRVASQSSSAVPYAPTSYQALKWRNVGPFRGGRSTTVCGVPSDPHTYYFGSVGGGIWKTTDGGKEWRNVSDGYLNTGSVGAIAVAPSDPNVLYVGMGEAPIRGVMTSHGDGVYASTDAGKSWQHRGLERVRQISKVRIHPEDASVVYVAAQGSPYAPTSDRGIYRSRDGGESWERVLFVNERSGACDLSMDPHNPRVLYAAFWDHQRLPWKVVSGGPGSSIWKSTDGGDTWEQLSEGLPEGVMGKIGLVVSPANSQRVWAIIEAEKGGLYRSDDGGKHWTLINEDRVLRARSWYYMHIVADPLNEETVYVLNAPVMKSIDGGKSFQPLPTPHGDNHDLWIHPERPEIMINANDGGANVSYNGGKSWSRQDNQPTAQFYRVNADNRFPYYIYGGQQDNSTVAIPNQTQGLGIANADFYPVGGCESAYCAFDPDDPMLVYAGCYQGIITEYDVEHKVEKDVMAYPYLGLGTKPEDVPIRFNWNAPIRVSQHDPSVIYHAGNRLLKSEDRGLHWETISPDLTLNVKEHLGWGGGPITNEGAGGEIYHTILYLAESAKDPQTLWVGSDDGLIHLTRDGGQNWTNITPPKLEEGMINAIELSPFEEGTAYVAYNRYKFNDFTPHVLITRDFGKSWNDMAEGMAQEAHVRVVRADPGRKGLLYAGTETGLYISFNDGETWNPFQLNLPVVPITDLKVHQGDLIAATQGRAFWVLDHLSVLHQLDEAWLKQPVALLAAEPGLMFGGPRRDSLPDRGTNPDRGVSLYYHLREVPEDDSLTLTLTIRSANGKLLRTYRSDASAAPQKAPKKQGLNKLVWDMQTAPYELPKGLMVIGGGGGYPLAVGAYTAELIYGNDTLQQPVEIKPDPRMPYEPAAAMKKQRLMDELGEAVDQLYEGVKDLRHVKTQVQALLDRLDEEVAVQAALLETGESLIADMDSLQASLVQEKQKTFQDVINFPNQLDAELLHILGTLAGAPPPITSGQEQRARDLLARWEQKERQLSELLGDRLEAYNARILEAAIPFVGKRSKAP